MAVPALVQRASGPNSQNGTGTANPTTYTARLPDSAQAGNCIVVVITYDNTGSPAVTVSDDKSGGTNTYSLGISELDSTHGQKFDIYYALNVQPARTITVSWNKTGQGFLSVHVFEFTNVATASAADGNNGNFTSGTSVTAGAVTPSTSGDLVIQGVFKVSDVAAASFTAGSQSNITWQLATSDLQLGMAVQWGVYNSTSSLNATMSTTGTNNNYVSAVLFLKSGASGSNIPSGIRIRGIQHIQLDAHDFTIQTVNTVAMPTYGTALIMAVVAGAATVTAVTDSHSNSWSSNSVYNGGATSDCQFWYCQSGTFSADMTLTVTVSDNTKDYTLMIYDVTGGSSTGLYDATSLGTAHGNQTTNTATITGAIATPSQASSLVIGMGGWDKNTGNGANSPIIFDAFLTNDEFLDGPQTVDQNNGWGHYYNSDTSSVTFTWQFVSSTDPQLTWSSMAAAFLRAPGTATTPTSYIGIGSKDYVLAVGTFDMGIPIRYGLYDDDFVAQFSGTVYAANVNGVRSVPTCVFDRDADVIGMLGVN